MTEMDFEELDKAVNSLMQKAGAVPSDSDGTPPTSVVSPDRNPSETATDSVQQASEKIADPSVEHVPATPPVSVAAKRQRRFMDIVPQKNSTASVPPVARPPKRQGATLQPITTQNELSTDTDKISSSLRDEPVAVESEAVYHSMPFDTEPATNSTNDATSQKDEGAYNQSDEAEAVTEYPSSPTVVQDAHEEIRSAQSSADIPLTSPFLPDAKVEKRPLGGSAPFQEPARLSSQDDTPQADEGVDEHGVDLQTAPDPTHVSLPEEFSGAIMAIESSAVPHAEERMENVAPELDKNDGTSSYQEPSAILPAPVVSPTPKNEDIPLLVSDTPQKHDSHKVNTGSAPSSIDDELFNDNPPAMMMSEDDEIAPKKVQKSRGSTKTIDPPKHPAVENGSIIQQYAEQLSTSSQENVAIYDTKSYHQPLEHPAKRTSSAVIVMWILVLLIAGALAGAAVFYFNSQ